jgi:25S rRNA (cytosine2870-C5)-methyltransferase
MLQSAASMVPVIALGAQPGERVLDVAAAPGGKTTHIAQCMGNAGVLVANDPKPERLPSLVANLARLGVTNSVVCSEDGRKLAEVFGKGSFDRALLDAPCTGLGVIARDPSARTTKGRADVIKMAHLQVRLGLGLRGWEGGGVGGVGGGRWELGGGGGGLRLLLPCK